MFKHLLTEIRHFVCHYNYKQNLRRLRNNSDKIRVIFLVTENAKWGYQSLYEQMDKDSYFEPIILVSLLNRVHKGGDKTRNNLEENYTFFENQGMNVDYAYKNGNYIDLKTFNPDIIFYEQPWDIPKIHKPLNVSKFALTCYCDYGLELVEDKDNYRENFHYLLYKFFVDSEINIKRYNSYNENAYKNCLSFGYPKLDIYFKPTSKSDKELWKDPNKKKVIYAPHHSFEDSGLKFTTFRWSGKYILDFAKSHQDYTWIFKPHPQFKFSLLNNNIMTEDEIENYYSEWNTIGNINTQGNYFDIFKTSDLMITDCCSFLGEYLPTNKPLIRLINEDSMKMNEFGEWLSSCCYNIHSVTEFDKTLNDVISSNNDYKMCERKDIISSFINYDEQSSSRICQSIKKMIEGEIS